MVYDIESFPISRRSHFFFGFPVFLSLKIGKNVLKLAAKHSTKIAMQ